jgi:hypothetical protein
MMEHEEINLLDDVVVSLENDGALHTWFQKFALNHFKKGWLTAIYSRMNMSYAPTRRLKNPDEQRYVLHYLIHRWLGACNMPMYPLTNLTPLEEDNIAVQYGDFLHTEQRVAAHIAQEMQMRVNADGIVTGFGIPATITGRRPDGVILDDLIKETPMKLTFSTKFLINGSDISELDNSNIYSRISAEEKRIADLEKIENKPKRLVAEIADAKATLQKLVAHLDAQ